MNKLINRQGLGLLIGLAIQYMLGMSINLFVEFPADKTPQGEWEFTLHNPLILLHLVIGTLLVFGSIVLVVRAVRQHAQAWKLPAISGCIWVLVAWIAGDTFVTSQADALSYLMSLAFLLAMLSYVLGLYRSRSTTPA